MLIRCTVAKIFIHPTPNSQNHPLPPSIPIIPSCDLPIIINSHPRLPQIPLIILIRLHIERLNTRLRQRRFDLLNLIRTINLPLHRRREDSRFIANMVLGGELGHVVKRAGVGGTLVAQSGAVLADDRDGSAPVQPGSLDAGLAREIRVQAVPLLHGDVVLVYGRRRLLPDIFAPATRWRRGFRGVRTASLGRAFRRAFVRAGTAVETSGLSDGEESL